MKPSYLLSLFLGFFCLSSNSIAQSIKFCESGFLKQNLSNENHKTNDLLNHRMSEKYPELSYALKSPEAFVEEMKKRFNIQKKETPNDPNSFNFSEAGIPLVRFGLNSLMQSHLQAEQELKNISEKLQSIDSSKIKKENITTLKNDFHEYQTAINYYKDLINESHLILNENRIGYRQTLEYAFYLTRLLGHFDNKKMQPLTKFYLNKIDRKYQGYEQLSMAQEYQLYKDKKFFIFQMDSTVKTFTASQQIFENIVLSKENLQGIIIPTTLDVERDIFYRLMTKNLSIVGVTKNPILADGFLRPSGDFYVHDLRHESVKYFERIQYRKKMNLTETQYNRMIDLQERWYLEYELALKNLTDKNLKQAIDLVMFNYIHDRGKPMIPSLWLERTDMHIYTGLMTMLRLSGEGTKFNFKAINNKRAEIWLNHFWKQRMAEEKNFLDNL